MQYEAQHGARNEGQGELTDEFAEGLDHGGSVGVSGDGRECKQF